MRALKVKGHMAALDAFSEQMCGPEHIRHGKCVGPSWSMVSALLSLFATSSNHIVAADRGHRWLDGNLGILESEVA